ncbi:MAG: hypothetical protein FWF98_04700 [Dehalococcoidia bacterium]|nr:hypothetical protein [Dehalococcoidia bacterium]
MALKWSEAYEDLKKFIAEHQEIKIDADGAVILSDIRTEFYRYFDTVRDAFVKEYFATEIESISELGNAYADISKLIKQDMNLEAIEVSGSLNGFLLEPDKSLMSALYSPLFNLLQGKTNEERFVLEAQKVVKAFFRPLFCEGYKRWGTLALLHLLNPDCSWDVDLCELDVEHNRNAEFFPGMYEEDVPELQQRRQLTFSYLQKASFIMSDVLVHSKKLGAYVSVKSQWYEVRCKAKQINQNMEWLDLEQLHYKYGFCRPETILDTTIHLARENADELKLLADYCCMARPDMLIAFMEECDWHDANHIERLILNNKIFNPRLGTYVISRTVVPQKTEPPADLQPSDETDSSTMDVAEAPEVAPVQSTEAESLVASSSPSPTSVKQPLGIADLPDSVHVINVGYDINALEPIVQVISQWLAPQDQDANQQHDLGELQITNQES